MLSAAFDPLVHENACVTFSNGTVHIGKAAVRSAYEANFAAIQDEHYEISNVHWARRCDDVAVYLHVTHRDDPGFDESLAATMNLYPDLKKGYKKSLNKAYKDAKKAAR